MFACQEGKKQHKNESGLLLCRLLLQTDCDQPHSSLGASKQTVAVEERHKVLAELKGRCLFAVKGSKEVKKVSNDKPNREWVLQGRRDGGAHAWEAI